MSIPSNPYPNDAVKPSDAANIEKTKDKDVLPVKTPENDKEIEALAKQTISNNNVEEPEPLDATRVKPEPVDEVDQILDVRKEILFPEDERILEEDLTSSQVKGDTGTPWGEDVVDDADVILDTRNEIILPEGETKEIEDESFEEEDEVSPSDEDDIDDVLRGKGV